MIEVYHLYNRSLCTYTQGDKSIDLNVNIHELCTRADAA
jgi:hypothetical protein